MHSCNVGAKLAQFNLVFWYFRCCTSLKKIHIVTDLINALPGNSSGNTVQHATIREAVFSISAMTSQQWIVITWRVFSVDPTDAPIDWLDSDHVICVYYRSVSSEINTLLVFEWKILWKIFGPSTENDSWRMKTNQELNQLINHKNIINFIRAQTLMDWPRRTNVT
jgi:hypothetical protein